MEMIRVTGLSKAYGPIKALQDVSFSVNAGEIIGYIGPNGSGKTTTIKAITGLCSIDRGSITILNEDALRDYVKIGKRVAVIFENHGLYLHLTAWENLEFYARLIDLPIGVRRARIRENLELAGLLDRSRSLTKTFSKGMLRKLAIARALLTEPQVLILDEPFDGIDVSSRLSIIRLLKTWIKEGTHCLLLTSHNMYEVEELSSRIMILKEGQIIASGPLSSLQKNTGQDLVKVALNDCYEDAVIETTLGEFGGGHAFVLEGHNLLVKIDRQEIPVLASLLHNHGVKFEEISCKRETLNEVYLRMVGHHE